MTNEQTTLSTAAFPPQERPMLSQVSWWHLTYIAVFTVGLLLRWINLDARPVHHDESLHFMYGRYFFDFPEQNFHRYDPMLHGPLLYNTLRLIYDMFGSSTWAGRAFIALLGSLFMFVPLLFRRYLHPIALFALTCAIVFSPTVTFWSRFLREDMLQIWAIIIVLCGVILAKPQLKPILVFLGIALQWCIKANLFVHAAIVLGFLLFELAFNFLFFRKIEGYLVDLLRSIYQFEAFYIAGFFVAAFVFVFFYTSGFRYSAGIIDGLWEKSFVYWLNQHNIERIPGPFLFHFYQLSWYELLFMLAVGFHMWVFYSESRRGIKIAGALTLFAGIVAAISVVGHPLEKTQPWKFFSLKDSLDVFGLFILIGHPILVTVQHLLDRRQSLAFFGYFFFAIFFSYSYLGEKVPWLALYPFCAGLIYLTLYFQDYFQRRPIPHFSEFPVWKILRAVGCVLTLLGAIFLLQEDESLYRNLPQGISAGSQFVLLALKNTPFITYGIIVLLFAWAEYRFRVLNSVNLMMLLFAVCILFNLRAAVMVNFINGGKASEFMSQVHTTKEFHDFVLDIRKQIESPTSGHKPTVYVTGEGTWPTTWYLVDLPEYKFNATPEELKNFDYRIQDFETDKNKQFPGFKRVDLALRGWWVPDYRAMTVEKFLRYSVSQKPWSPTGFSYVTVLVKDSQQEKSAVKAP